MYITYVYCAIIEPRLWNIVPGTKKKKKKKIVPGGNRFFFGLCRAEIVSAGRPRPAPPTVATTLGVAMGGGGGGWEYISPTYIPSAPHWKNPGYGHWVISSSELELVLTRSLREPGGPCTKSMEVSESRMERVKGYLDNNSGLNTKMEISRCLGFDPEFMTYFCSLVLGNWWMLSA